MVIFGPVLDGSGSWGLGVIEGDDEEEIRVFAGGDPVITSGTADIEVGKLLAGTFDPGDLLAGDRRPHRHAPSIGVRLA